MPDLRQSIRLVLAASLFSLIANQAFAQNSGLFGGRGPVRGSNGMSTGSVGTSIGGSTLTGVGGVNTSSFGGSSGLGGMGQQSFGAQRGLTSSFGSSGATGYGSGTGSGFVGRSDTSGRFVGNNQAGNQGMGAGGRNGQNQLNQFSRGGFSRGMGAAGQQGYLQQAGSMGTENVAAGASKMLHPQQRVAFTYKLPDAEVASKTLITRFDRLMKRPALKGVSGLQFDMQGNVLTLRGAVDSDETKRLIGMLAGLEPGVSQVHNDLTIDHSLPRAPGVAAPK